MLLALAEAVAKSEAAPYVGGGLGVAALVYGVTRISTAVSELVRMLSRHLSAWGEHREAESKHWKASRALLDQLAEEREKRDADAAAARRYLTEQRAITDRHDALQRRLDGLERRMDSRQGASLDGS